MLIFPPILMGKKTLLFKKCCMQHKSARLWFFTNPEIYILFSIHDFNGPLNYASLLPSCWKLTGANLTSFNECYKYFFLCIRELLYLLAMIFKNLAMAKILVNILITISAAIYIHIFCSFFPFVICAFISLSPSAFWVMILVSSVRLWVNITIAWKF